MSNRKKPQNPTGPIEDTEVRVPIQEQTVHKRVPAVIHFSQVEGTDREDDEVIGETILYEDGTCDIIVFGDISPEAKQVVGIIQGQLEHLSLED